MSHAPDPSHDRHDLELIAAHAAGDLADTGLADAERLLATCTACAELHADLRAIAAAIPAIPPRRRTRDYRLTPGQADALRPRGWRRILAAFGSPRLAFTAPLGTGLAALGIAGLLLTGAPSLLPAGGLSGAPGANDGRGTLEFATGVPAAPTDLAAPAVGSVDQSSQEPDRLHQATAAPGPVPPASGELTDSPAATAGEAPFAVLFGALVAAGLLLAGVGLLGRRTHRA